MWSKVVYIITFFFCFGITSAFGYTQVQKKIIKLDKTGKQGYLGVEIQDVTKKFKEKKNLSVDRGAYVQSVVEDSPAEEAGILKGDVIVKFGDEGVDDSEELTDAVRATKPKTEVKIELYRNSEKKIITATVGKLKGASAYAFSYGGDGLLGLKIPPKSPKLGKTFNLRVYTESEINGIHVQPLTKQLGEYFGVPKGKGVLVAEIGKGSDADKAGFKAGDVITKVDDRSIDDVDEFREEVSDIEGKGIPFEIIRNGKSMKLHMDIEREEMDEDFEDDWSCNPNWAPRSECIKSFNLHHNHDLDDLKDRLFEMGENLRSKLQNMKRSIRNRLIES